jgi:hypothetical protein
MLRRARLWHAIAAEFARSAIAPRTASAASTGDVAAAVTATAGDQARILL